MGVTLIDQGQESCQNCAKKLQARLKWAYQKAQENSRKESERQKRYYDKKNEAYEFKTRGYSPGTCKSPIWTTQNCRLMGR